MICSFALTSPSFYSSDLEAQSYSWYACLIESIERPFEVYVALNRY